MRVAPTSGTRSKKRGSRSRITAATGHKYQSDRGQHVVPETPPILPRFDIHAIEPHPGFFVVDDITGTEILIDTGAFVSVWPASQEQRASPQGCNFIRLKAANGSPIPTHGTRHITLQLGGLRAKWQFVIADVQRPLLGADFFDHHGLMIDIKGRQLVDRVTFRPALVPISSVSPSEQWPNSIGNLAYGDVINDFPEVFRRELSQTPGVGAKHGIYHHIKTHGPPAHQKFRRLPPDKLEVAKQYFADMVKMGVCAKAASPWAAPLHMTLKADNTYRPCGDYRNLNRQTEPDHYPVPNMADLLHSLHGAKVFSKLDLLKGYFQVPVWPEDVPKTAIITPFGSYVFYYSTFGLKNSGATFQRLMDTIFGEVSFVVVYIDDLLIFSRNHTEHKEHLRTVLRLLRDNGLICKPEKCVFGSSSVEFLGHVVSGDGIRPNPDKVKAITRFPRPTSVKEVQEYLGLINFYARFVPKAASHLAPLHELIKGKPKELSWTDTSTMAFEEAKRALAEAVTLAYPVPGLPITITTDASDVAVGACLEQHVNGIVRPLAFFSRKLRPPERRYSTFDRELLAIFLALRHFRHFVMSSNPVTIRTDHKPIVQAFVKSSDAWTSRQQRHLSAIAETGCTIEHLPGSLNPVADALSRVEIESCTINSVVLGIDYAKMAEAQAADHETAAYRTSISSLRWREIKFGDSTLLCDVSTGKPRPLVPREFRRQVFDAIHSLSHPSARSTLTMIKARFIWHSISRDVKTWARLCDACQRCKIGRHTESGIGEFTQPRRRFGHIHVDVVGPLAVSHGFRYLFTIVDRSTRWPEAIPMVESTASACAAALLHGWVASKGVPDTITSDRGRAFTSHLWSSLATLLGVNCHQTTSFNPEANGLVERSHRSLKQALMARLTGDDWISQLPWVLLGLRTTPKEGLAHSAAEMTYGEALAVPGEFFPPSANAEALTGPELSRVREVVGKFAPCLPTRANHREAYIPKSLFETKYVFVRHDAYKPPLTPPYKGPFLVLRRGEKAFQLEINGHPDWVSIDRLKPAYTDETETPSTRTTRCGRPSRPPIRLLL